MTLEPGLLALSYKTRWEIENVFDETKIQLAEKKSWATMTTAKEMQAHYQPPGVENTAEKAPDPTENRTPENGTDMAVDLHSAPMRPAGDVQPHSLAARHWHRSTPLHQALLQLRARSAKL